MEELVPLPQNGWIQEERLQAFLGLVLSLFPAKGNHSSPRTLTGQDWQGRIRMTARSNAVPCGRRAGGAELPCEFPGQLSRTMSEKERGERHHPITRPAFVTPHNIFKAQLLLPQASDRQSSTPSSFQPVSWQGLPSSDNLSLSATSRHHIYPSIWSWKNAPSIYVQLSVACHPTVYGALGSAWVTTHRPRL